VPYLVWVSIAGALNASVWMRNPNEAAQPTG
jgi:tryptophan-rich sensory protein